MNELWSPTIVSSQPSQQNTNNSTIHRFSRKQPTVHASHYNQILRELHEMSGQDKANLTCPPPLQPFHNKLVWQNAHDDKDDESTIPRILHVSHKSRCLAPDFVGNLEIWAEQLPRFSIIFYDDEAVERIFGHATAVATFPLLNHIRQCALYKGAMKIDIWRVLIVYIYGGFYTDMDNTPSENFREVRPHADAHVVTPANYIGQIHLKVHYSLSLFIISITGTFYHPKCIRIFVIGLLYQTLPISFCHGTWPPGSLLHPRKYTRKSHCHARYYYSTNCLCDRTSRVL